MKPLPAAPPTREDLEIWRRLALRHSIARMCLIAYAAERSDRRDAELMFALADVRSRMEFPVQCLAMLVANGWLRIEKNGMSVVEALRI